MGVSHDGRGQELQSVAAQQTIGILYPGEMGSRLGRVLAEGGGRVVTTTEGRSARTRKLCRDAALATASSVSELLNQSDILISLVSPAAAVSTARYVAESMIGLPKKLLFVDANSISPESVAEVVATLGKVGVPVVDAAIFGLASQLTDRGRVYLSGSRAEDVKLALQPLRSVQIVGAEPGAASALKMIVSGIPKGISMLLIETLLLAQQMGLLEEALSACGEIYPGVMEIANRMVPTYPQHAARRGEELREVERTMRGLGLAPQIIPAVRAVTDAIARAEWTGDTSSAHWPVAEVIRELQRQRVLSDSEPAAKSEPDA